MAVLSSMPCPVDGCAAHLRVTATAAGWSSSEPNAMVVTVNVDQAGRDHLESHLTSPEPSPTQ